MVDVLAHYLKTKEFKEKVKVIKETINSIEHRYKHKGEVSYYVSSTVIEPIVEITRNYCEAIYIEWEEEIMNLVNESNRSDLAPIREIMKPARAYYRKLEKLINSEHVCDSCELGKDKWVIIYPED